MIEQCSVRRKGLIADITLVFPRFDAEVLNYLVRIGLQGQVCRVARLHVFFEKELHVEGLTAQGAGKLLPVGVKVSLEKRFASECLLAQETSIRCRLCQVGHLHVESKLGFRSVGGIATVTLEHLTFIAVLDGEMDLNPDLGIEHVPAQRATVKMVSMKIE